MYKKFDVVIFRKKNGQIDKGTIKSVARQSVKVVNEFGMEFHVNMKDILESS